MILTYILVLTRSSRENVRGVSGFGVPSIRFGPNIIYIGELKIYGIFEQTCIEISGKCAYHPKLKVVPYAFAHLTPFGEAFFTFIGRCCKT